MLEQRMCAMSQMSGWFAREFFLSQLKLMYVLSVIKSIFNNTYVAKMQRDTGEMTTTNSTWPTLMVNICIFKPNTL